MTKTVSIMTTPAGPVDGRNPEETRDFDWNFRLFTRYEQEADK